MNAATMPAENSVEISGKTTDNDPQMGDEFAAKQKRGAERPF
jgi:hypothetical protein